MFGRLTASTWRGWEILPSELLDLLIIECDQDKSDLDEQSEYQFLSNEVSKRTPFSVFSVTPPTVSSLARSLCRRNTIQPAIPPWPDLSHGERLLFHHYVTHVSLLMMPYHHPRNPWQSHYPATALQQVSTGNQRALYSAMLAQSAFNLCYLQRNMSFCENEYNQWEYIGSRHYTAAIQHLRPCVARRGNNDDSGSVSPENINTLLASIMTIMFSEVYSGQPRTWRHHVAAAWAFLCQSFSSDEGGGAGGALSSLETQDRLLMMDNPAHMSSLQSLNIVRIIGDTSRPDDDDAGVSPSDDNSRRKGEELLLEEAISSTPDFGFTIGATRPILECIAEITAFRTRRQRRLRSQHLKTTSDIRHEQAEWAADDNDEEHAKTEEEEPVVEDLLQTLLTRLKSAQDAIEQQQQQGNETTTTTTGFAAAAKLPVPDVQTIQNQAFLHATYIYLHRTLLSVPPRAVQARVRRTLDLVLAFYDTSIAIATTSTTNVTTTTNSTSSSPSSSTSGGGGSSSNNFSIWPAFIAAVEAYTPEDQGRARQWLALSGTHGVGSRRSVARVVEEVWNRRRRLRGRSRRRRRKSRGGELGEMMTAGIPCEDGDGDEYDLGDVAVDWREVMHDLGCDVLLV